MLFRRTKVRYDASHNLSNILYYFIEICLSDSCLEKALETYMLSPEIRSKFVKFLKLLEDLQRTTTWVQMFRWRRAMVIGLNLLRNILNFKVLSTFIHQVDSTLETVQLDFETIKCKFQKAFLYATIYIFHQAVILKNSTVQSLVNFIIPLNLQMVVELK